MAVKILNRGTDLVFYGSLSIALILLILPREVSFDLVQEAGLVENMSLVVLGIGLVAAGIKLWWARNTLWMAGFAVLVWMFLRELDFHARFTARSIESIGYYSNPEIALRSKFLAVAAMVPFAVAGGYLLHRAYKLWKSGRLAGQFWYRRAKFAVAAVAIALVSEKFLPDRAQVVEEIMELAFVTLIIVTVCQLVFTRSNDTPKPAVEPE